MSRSKEEIVYLFSIVRDCDDEDWLNNEKRFKEMIAEYVQQEAIEFAEWCGKHYAKLYEVNNWRDMNNAEDIYTTEQLYQIFQQNIVTDASYGYSLAEPEIIHLQTGIDVAQEIINEQKEEIKKLQQLLCSRENFPNSSSENHQKLYTTWETFPISQEITRLKELIKDAHTKGWLDFPEDDFQAQHINIESSWQQFQTDNNL